MRPGQEQALNEVRSIAQQGADLEIISSEEGDAGRLIIDIALSLEGVPVSDDGIPLRQRERFTLIVAPGFPFNVPTVRTPHLRWAGWSHVQWGHQVCLYESPQTDWDPSDGMFGLIEQLVTWLERAAVNQLDETGAPLHPPVAYVSDRSLPVIVYQANTPADLSEPWVGFVSTRSVSDFRVDVTGWSDDEDFADGSDAQLGVGVLLASPLSFEFPTHVRDLLAALETDGVQRRNLLIMLGVAAFTNPKDEPLYVVIGTPMRGIRGGARQQHLTTWRLDPIIATGLRLALHQFSDATHLRELGEETAAIIEKWSEDASVKWCRSDDAREEVTIRRDAGSPLEWFRGRKVSVWGCGAIGTHAAEMLVRAGVASLVLRDSSLVKLGVLTRQSFEDRDVGRAKVTALAERLTAIRPDLEVDARVADILTDPLDSADWTDGADLVIDATASEMIAKKLELVRHRGRVAAIPPIASLSFGHDATRGLLTLARATYSGGTRDLIRKSQVLVCSRPELEDIADDFWGRGRDRFYPEPGCSDPTFRGSHAEVLRLVGAMVLKLAAELRGPEPSSGSSHFFGPSESSKERAILDFRFSPDVVLTDAIAGHQVRLASRGVDDLRMRLRRSHRTAGARNETGGHLLGERDSASQVIWIDEVWGPPPDSRAAEVGFISGTRGLALQAELKEADTRGATRFLGMWHSHPEGVAVPSETDHLAMTSLLSAPERPPQGHSLLMVVGGDTMGEAHLCAALYSADSLPTLARVQESARKAQAQIDLSPPQPVVRDVAIALSGGGSRAIAFQLGCSRALHDRGLLPRVNVLSAASGGSVLAAIYAYSAGDFGEFDNRVRTLLRSGITREVMRRAIFSPAMGRSLLTMSTAGVIAAGVLAVRLTAGMLGIIGAKRFTFVRSAARLEAPMMRTHSRTNAFVDVLRRRVVGNDRMADVKRDGLHVIINATELRTGTAFRFGSRESGSSHFGRIRDNDVSVAEAIAASAAYPTLLPAIDRRYKFISRDGSVKSERVVLSDGGIYDNLATSALEPGRTYPASVNVFPSKIIISCDGGRGGGVGPPPYFWPERVSAAVAATHRRTQNLTRARLFQFEETGQIDGLVTAFLGMQDDRVPYAPADLVPREVATRYPTDFAPMSETDIETLSMRGEQIMTQLASQYLS